MIREWTVTRQPPNGQVVLGTFDLGGGLPCVSLERLAVMIPEGRYPLSLTVSARAAAGTLWAPYEDHRLPLLGDVPGRTAIRCHSGNDCSQSNGCILVGSEHDATELMYSRQALTRIVNELRECEEIGDEVWLTVKSHA